MLRLNTNLSSDQSDQLQGFRGVKCNDASWGAVVDVFRGSLVQAQVGARTGMEARLLQWDALAENRSRT